MTLRAVGLALCAATIGFSQTTTDWRFAHPDAEMRMSVNLQAILKSPFVTAALAKAQETATPEQKTQMQFVLGMLSSIDTIAVSARDLAAASSRPAAATRSPKAGAAAPNTDALVLVTGSFDPATVQKLFPSTGTSKVQQIGPHTILIGEGASFIRAVQRMSGPAPSAPPDELEQSDLWIEGSGAVMSQPGSQVTLPALKDLKRFSIGLNLRDSLDVNLNLTAGNDAAAGQILTTLQGLMAMAGASPQAASLQQMLQFRQEGPVAKVHMNVPPQMLQAMQNGIQSGAMGSQLQPLLGRFGISAPGTAAAPAAAAPPPPPAQEHGDIVIYGLEGGPKVIKQN